MPERRATTVTAMLAWICQSCYIQSKRTGEGPWCKTQESPRRVRRLPSKEQPPGADTPAKAPPAGQGSRARLTRKDRARENHSRQNGTGQDRPAQGRADQARSDLARRWPRSFPFNPPPGVVGVPPARRRPRKVSHWLDPDPGSLARRHPCSRRAHPGVARRSDARTPPWSRPRPQASNWPLSAMPTRKAR